ncbi:MAG: hypothetical protein M1831_006195 [Alyxoria varia]|nr:MAG: hypothetical protein M1831_006195 [Alyxoria varia]
MPDTPLTPGDDSNNITRPERESGIDEEAGSEYLEEFDRSRNDEDADEAEEVQGGVSTSLEDGAIVELFGGGGLDGVIAVSLRRTGSTYVFYTASGRIYFDRIPRAQFISPGQFSQEELEPVLRHCPTDTDLDTRGLLEEYQDVVPRSVGSAVVQKLMAFDRDSKEAYRQHSKVFDQAFDLIAHPTNMRVISLQSIADKLVWKSSAHDGSYPEPLLHALALCLRTTNVGFHMFNRDFYHRRYFYVESKASIEQADRAIRAIRAYQEELALVAGKHYVPAKLLQDTKPLKGFVRKARILIRESRRFRYTSPEGDVLGIPPEQALKDDSDIEHVCSLSFSASDQDFIHFMLLNVAIKCFDNHPTIRGLPKLVLRAVGLYHSPELDDSISSTFLVEIGVLQPYTNPMPFNQISRSTDKQLTELMAEIDTRVEAGEKLKDLVKLEDTMAPLRQDWGNMPIFCIDSEGTRDVDDAISLEEVPDSDGQVWVHVHIAHLSAFAPPSHPFARAAENLVKTHFLPDSRPTMLPKAATQDFSVGSDKPVLTFSTKVDSSGMVLDFKIQPGRVHNIVKFSTNAVDEFFKSPPREDKNWFQFATGKFLTSSDVKTKRQSVDDYDNTTSNTSTALSRSELLPSHRSTIIKLMSVAQRLRSQRVRNKLMGRPMRSVMKARGPKMQFSQPPQSPTFSKDSPSIKIKTNPRYKDELYLDSALDVPSYILVQELMIQTNVQAGKWCADRDIPTVYWGTEKVADDENMRNLRERLERMASGKEPFDIDTFSLLQVSVGARYIGSRPKPLRTLDFPQYCQVSSPLRRYLDLLSHWQIDSALRSEAAMAGKESRAEEGKKHSGSGSGSGSNKDESSLGETESPTNHSTSSVTASPPRPLAPHHLRFAAWNIDALISQAQARQSFFHHFATAHRTHIAMLAVARAHYLGDGKLPSPLTVTWSERMGDDVVGWLDQVWVRVRAPLGPLSKYKADRGGPDHDGDGERGNTTDDTTTETNPGNHTYVENGTRYWGAEDVKPGDRWEVRLQRVFMRKRFCVVTPVRWLGPEPVRWMPESEVLRGLKKETDWVANVTGGGDGRGYGGDGSAGGQ